MRIAAARFLSVWVATSALAMVGCANSECGGASPPADGVVWPDEARTLRVPLAGIARLAIARDGALCAAVHEADGPLTVGCFEGCDFVRIGTISSTPAAATSLVVRNDHDVAVVFERRDVLGSGTVSCLASLHEGHEPTTICTDAAVRLESADIDVATGLSLSNVASIGSSDVLLPGDILLRQGVEYLVEDPRLTDASQLHPLSAYAQPPSVVASDGRGGWVVAGDYLSTATGAEWGLPDGGGPFWMRLDATLAPTSSRAYDGAGAARWALDPRGEIVGVMSHVQHVLVSETAMTPVPIGHGGYVADLAVGRDTIAVRGGFTRFVPAPAVFGSLSTSSTETRSFIVALDRTGVARWLGLLPATDATNAVVLDDGSIAIGSGDTVHVLAAH